MLDLSKPMRLVCSVPSGTTPKHFTPIPIDGGDFFVQHGKSNYWRAHADGTVDFHPTWRVENCPPPPVTHTARVIFYKSNFSGGVSAISFSRPDMAEVFITDLKISDNYIGDTTATITVQQRAAVPVH